MEAEKQRRDLILLEEQKLADQRVRYVNNAFSNVPSPFAHLPRWFEGKAPGQSGVTLAYVHRFCS